MGKNAKVKGATQHQNYPKRDGNGNHHKDGVGMENPMGKNDLQPSVHHDGHHVGGPNHAGHHLKNPQLPGG